VIRLEGLRVSSAVVGQCTINAVVDAPGVKVGSQLCIDTLRMPLVKTLV